MQSYKGGGSVPEHQTQTITYEPSEYQKKWATPLMRGAHRLMGRQHSGFGSDRVSQLDPMERKAFKGVESLYEAGERPELGYAFGQAQQAGATGAAPGQWGMDAYQQYASPYQEGVLALGRDRIMEEYERAIPGITASHRDAAYQSGQIGGSGDLRQDAAQARLADEAFKNVREYQAQGQQYGYEQSLAAFQNQQRVEQEGAQIQLQAAQEARALAQAQQSQAMQRLAAMQEAGYSQREIDQAMRDIAYENFIEKRDWKANQLALATNIVYGNPAIQQSNRTGVTDRSGGGARGPSGLAQAAGLGIAGIGAIGAIS